MKGVLIIVAGVLLIGIGAFIKFGAPSISLGKPTIQPCDKWADILYGKWEYKYRGKNDHHKNEFNGDISFNRDSSYVLRGNGKLFARTITNEEGYSSSHFVSYGGHASGKWCIKNEIVNTPFEDCQLKTTYSNGQYAGDVCKLLYEGFANASTNEIEMKFIEFNHKRICCVVHQFSDNDSTVIELTKIEK